MDIRELKQLLQRSPSVLIVEDGEPSLVVVDYETYRSMTDVAPNPERRPAPAPVQSAPPAREPGQPSLSTQEAEMIDRLNKEILALKEQIEAEEREVLGR